MSVVQNSAGKENLLQSLVETSLVAIAVNDFDGHFLYVNPRALELHGYSMEELQRLTLWDINAPQSVLNVAKIFTQLREQGEAIFEVQHMRKDGTILPLQVYSKTGKWQGKDVILSIGTDITIQKLVEQQHDALILEKENERLKIQTALKESKEKYRSLVENIPDVVWTSDEERKTHFISRSVINVLGFTPEELMEDPGLRERRIHKEDAERVRIAYARLINQNIRFDVEYRIQRKDGNWIWVHDRASTTYTLGQTRYVDGLFWDITEHKREEDELLRYRAHLEEVVQERTKELERKNKDLLEEIAERKRAESALLESEKTFRTLAESSPNLIFINQERKIVYVNPRCAEVMGYSLDEFFDLHFDFIQLIAPEHREVIKEIFQRHGKGEEAPSMEYSIIRKDGTRLAAIYGSRLILYHGKPAILGVVTDITERKFAEEALRKSEAQLKDAQVLGKIGSWEFDLITQKIAWSDQTFSLFDRDPALGPPSPFEEGEYYPPEERRRLQGLAERASMEGINFRYDTVAQLKNGRSVFLSCTMQPIKDSRGQVIKLFGTVQDITERRKIEEQLTQTNQFLDTIIDNIPLQFSVKDAHTFKYVRVNRIFEEQVKMKQSAIVGKTADKIYSLEEAKEILKEDREVIEKKQIQLYEGRTSRGGRIYRVIKLPIFNPNDEVDHILTIADDITERLKIEQERRILYERTLQISDYKSNLLSHTAHELKTPLTVIMGWGELLYNAKKQGKSLDSTFDLEEIGTILRNAERLNHIIDDFLDMGAIDKGRFQLYEKNIDFSTVIENAKRAVNYLAVQKDATILMELAPTGSILVDPRRMEQVMINLFSNAIKYSPEHSTVTVKTSLWEKNGRSMLRVEIIDQGFGFTPTELAEVLTPFGKVKTQQEQKRLIQGTGLGVFISHQIVEQHGGTLVFRSEGINKGTRVEILLPVEKQKNGP